jgi:hypothetical protein
MAKCPELGGVKLSTDLLEAGRRRAEPDSRRHTPLSGLVGGAPMGSSRSVFEALQRPLTIACRRASFRGPAWAVLCAYAMFLAAGTFLTVAAFVAAQRLEPRLVKYVLTVGKWLLSSP